MADWPFDARIIMMVYLLGIENLLVFDLQSLLLFLYICCCYKKSEYGLVSMKCLHLSELENNLQ
jgi:hypothetical protein